MRLTSRVTTNANARRPSATKTRVRSKPLVPGATEGRLIASSAVGLWCALRAGRLAVADLMLGRDGTAPAGCARRRRRAGGGRRRRRGRGLCILAGARAPEGVQPAQPAALERDHARPPQVRDAGDLGPRVGLGGADAGAQREHAPLGPRHLRQASLEAQDGAAQGALAAEGLRGGAVGQAVGGVAPRGGARGTTRAWSG